MLDEHALKLFVDSFYQDIKSIHKADDAHFHSLVLLCQVFIFFIVLEFSKLALGGGLLGLGRFTVFAHLNYLNLN